MPRCVLLVGLPYMQADIFDIGELAMPLEKEAEVICDSLDRELAACRLPACVHHHLVDKTTPVLRPFIEEIKDVVEPGDLLNEVLALNVNGLLKSFECHGFPPFVALSANDLGTANSSIKRSNDFLA
jgi:hypothetical protein